MMRWPKIKLNTMPIIVEVEEPIELTEEELEEIMVQAMIQEAKKDHKAYFQKLLEEADRHPCRRFVDDEKLRKFLNQRFHLTTNSGVLKIIRLNRIYDYLRECHLGWEREVFLLLTYSEHPASYVIEELFYQRLLSSIRFQ